MRRPSPFKTIKGVTDRQDLVSSDLCCLPGLGRLALGSQRARGMQKRAEVSGAWLGTPPPTHKTSELGNSVLQGLCPQEHQGTGLGFSLPVGGEHRDGPRRLETCILPSRLLYSGLLRKGGALRIRCLSSLLRGHSKHTQEREGVRLCRAEMRIPTPAPTLNSGHRPAWSVSHWSSHTGPVETVI